MIKLYDVDLSGNCHKVRLLLSMLGLEHETVAVDLFGGEHKRPAFLGLNPMGQVPVLTDGDLTLRDSQAILVYLGRRYGGDTWLPGDAADVARIAQWLSTAANELQNGPGAARLGVAFDLPADVPAAQEVAAAVLAVMDGHLDGRDWLELDRPTVADLACYPYVALAPEGEVSLEPYPRVQAWVRRVEALPGYVPMPGLPREG